MKPRITYFEEYRTTGGWIWREEHDDPITGERVSTGYRTNGNGEGLWVHTGDGPWTSDKQILGLTQYSLPADRTKARAKVNRQMMQYYEEAQQ